MSETAVTLVPTCDTTSHHVSLSNVQRYRSLAILTAAAGAIYPLLYLRQNFEGPLLEALGISLATLNQASSWLGAVFLLSYAPSGWLADRVDPKILIVSSLAGTGVIGYVFGQLPEPDLIKWLFSAWGLTTGLTFWSALIKEVNGLAGQHHQGRFFGILEGGRGLVEALLATAAVAIFAYLSTSDAPNSVEAMRSVIGFYTAFVFAMATLTWLLVPPNHKANAPDSHQVAAGQLFADLRTIASNAKVWWVIVCILTGYQFLWATYSFSGYLQNHWGMSASIAASITLAKLWTRPIGAVLSGFLGDRFRVAVVLHWSFIVAAIAMFAFALAPVGSDASALAIIAAVGLCTYSVRGLYWAILDDCAIPRHLNGLAIGFISLFAFTPEIYLPRLNTYLLTLWPDGGGYTVYFIWVAAGGVLGAYAAKRL